MSKKCKFCFSTLSEQNSVCNVCKIDCSKDKKAMTKEEKKIVYHCRTLNIIGFLAILGGIVGIIKMISSLVGLTAKAGAFAMAIDLILAVLFLAFGFSLRTYKQWCYVGGIVLYSIVVILGLLSANILSILFGILFLCYIAAPTSKKIIYRQI